MRSRVFFCFRKYTYAILFAPPRPGYLLYLCLIAMSSSSKLKGQTPKAIIPRKKYKVCCVINCNNNLKSIDKRTNKHVKLHGFPDSTKLRLKTKVLKKENGKLTTTVAATANILIRPT